MERAHKKSVFAETNSLILAAHDLGEGLLWARYEEQLPLCAFSGNGLNCRKCFQGPCRINPFGDEPSRGICGADRDQIVMENLFLATVEGVLETARSLKLTGAADTAAGFPDIESGLPRETRDRLSELGLFPIRKGDLFEVQNSYFSHKGFLSQTLRDMTRLGLIHYGLLKEAEASITQSRMERSPFRSNGINLLMVGQAPVDLIRNLEEQALQKAGEKKVNLFVQGMHQLPSMQAAADHGSPELAFGMDLNGLIISPNASLPGLEQLAEKYDLPITLLAGKESSSQTASETIEKALLHAKRASYKTSLRMIPAAKSEGGKGPIWDRGQELKRAFEAGKIRGWVVLFGEANARQTFFERSLALMEASLAERFMVLIGGDLGSEIDLLSAELSRRAAGLLASFASDLGKERLSPFYAFGSSFEMPKVVSLFHELTGGKAVRSFPVIIGFPEFYRTSTWATAASFLSLGFAVQIGARLPFWGSPAMTEVLLKDWPKMTGGKLLASPALPDHQSQAEEMISYLKARKAE